MPTVGAKQSKLKYLLVLLVLVVSLFGSYYFTNHLTTIFCFRENKTLAKNFGVHKTNVIGFLPYWLINNASADYSKNLTNLTYFGLAVSGDGTILKKSNSETEPGWAKFDSSDLKTKLTTAKKRGLETSLLLYAADSTSIDEMIKNPETAGKNLATEIIPLMKNNKYTDLDIDLETLRVAKPDEQIAFTKFLKIVSETIKENNFTLTICLPVGAFSYDTIISPIQIQPLVDRVVIMTYDYFYRGSVYAGPNAPLDEVESVMKSALTTFKSEQIVLGIPLYGYTWETLTDTPGTAIIPSSGETFTQKELVKLLTDCSECKTVKNDKTTETTVSYLDKDTGSYHMTYYSDSNNFKEKIALVKKYNLGGVAFWALGYEPENYLSPFKSLKNYYWQDDSKLF